MGIRSDLQTELKNLLASDIIKGKVSVQRAYADWRRYPQYIVPLAESSIDMIMAPAYGSAKKNATDIRLAIDALELVFVRPEIGTFILLSGDSDFSSLVIKLKEYGKYVIGVGIRESSSDLLVMNCDEYYSYNALAGLVKSGEEEVVKHDPWELVTEAVQRMKRNGDVMRADRLKQVMQQIDSSFDEKNVGKAKFSLFVTEAAKRGLVALNKLENGQLEVDLPREADRAAETQPAVQSETATEKPAQQSAQPEEEERARRSGRKGRGRGRERDDRGKHEREHTRAESKPQQAEPVTPSAPQSTPQNAPQAREEKAPDGIGASGIKLNRDEAFDLVKRAVEASGANGKSAPASKVRSQARDLLGRDSESLNERNFMRILHDAHDADVIDLRRRGGDFEVAPAAVAAPVNRQLEVAEKANTPAPKPQEPVARGMGARGIGRGRMGAKGPPPANLLVGVVSSARPAAAPIAAPTNTAKAPEDEEAVAIVEASETAAGQKPARGRKRPAAKKAAKPAAKTPRARKKTAGKTAGSE
jgi:uncharacterized LabA/DUF88 family protein